MLVCVFVFILFLSGHLPAAETHLDDIYSFEDIEQAGEKKDTMPMSSYFGEEISYDVYLKNVRIGRSVLTFHGEADIEGEVLYYITFSTRTYLFNGVEEIYADKETLLPRRVEREIRRIGGIYERITENYDQDNYIITIRKRGRLLSKQFKIEKEAPIHNAIILPYYFRSRIDMVEGKTISVNLPTSNFEVSLDGEENISTELGDYNSYVFDSQSSEFTVWLSKDEEKIPLKINTPGRGGVLLVINSYESGAKRDCESNP